MTREPSDIVTSIITHEIIPEATHRYEQWLADIRKTCERFEGYLSTDVIRPLGQQHTYVVIIRFDGFENLTRWMESAERREFLKRMQPFLPKGDRYQIRTGLEFWFEPPAHKPATPWKQWLVTWSAIFPLSVLVPWLLGPVFALWPFPGESIVARMAGSAVIVLLMVYVVMPRYTKAVAGWLFR